MKPFMTYSVLDFCLMTKMIRDGSILQAMDGIGNHRTKHDVIYRGLIYDRPTNQVLVNASYLKSSQDCLIPIHRVVGIDGEDFITRFKINKVEFPEKDWDVYDIGYPTDVEQDVLGKPFYVMPPYGVYIIRNGYRFWLLRYRLFRSIKIRSSLNF